MTRGATVYRIYATDKTLLYVGMTSLGVNRMKQHSLTASWWPEAAYIHLEQFDSERTAAERERRLIDELAPLHNRSHRFAEISHEPFDLPDAPERAA